MKQNAKGTHSAHLFVIFFLPCQSFFFHGLLQKYGHHPECWKIKNLWSQYILSMTFMFFLRASSVQHTHFHAFLSSSSRDIRIQSYFNVCCNITPLLYDFIRKTVLFIWSIRNLTKCYKISQASFIMCSKYYFMQNTLRMLSWH